jgi:predicted O-methyltransferase YrrM
VGTFTNLSRIARKSIGRLGDAAFHQRLANMHRAMATMGRGKLAEYLGVSRDLLRTVAAEGMTELDECLLLMRLASEVRHGAIVEIGCYRGRSTIALAIGSIRGTVAPVFAIDPHETFTGVLGGRFGPDDKAAFLRNIEQADVSHVVRLISDSSASAAARWNTEIGLLWIDGDHRFEAVKKDFELWSPFLSGDGHIAFDDSTVSGLGPHMLIGEIVSEGKFEVLETVGKVTVMGRSISTV